MADREQMDRLDARIAEQHDRYIEAYFDPNRGPDVAAVYAEEVNRLLELRWRLMTGGDLADLLERQ